MGVMTLHLLGYENVQGYPASFAGWQAAALGDRLQVINIETLSKPLPHWERGLRY
jgi:hypothetical protein